MTPRKSFRPAALAAIATLLAIAAACDGSSSREAAETEAFTHRLKLEAHELDPRAEGIGRRVEDLALEDLEGETVRFSDYSDRPALALIVRDVGCPVSKRYGMRMGRLEAEFAKRDVPFLFINESPHNTREEMLGEVELYGYRGRYVHDPEQVFGKLLGVKTTTEVFVLDAALTLVYRGAVDDQYGRGVILPEPRREFLRGAVEATLRGDEVPVKATFPPGCFLGIEEDEAPPEVARVTYHRDVSRILQQNCVECHRSGGAAPFPLETLEQARGRKGMVRYMVEERLMPPWFASEDSGPWKNDRRLADADREAVLGWIADGMPAGDPADAPLPRRWKSGWEIGEPDLVFQLPAPFEVPADGVVEYMPFVAEEIVPEDIWIERLQLLPGDPEVVHHATITYRTPEGPSRGAFREDILGALVPWSRGYGGWRFLYGYLPGKGPRFYGEDTARFLPKGSRIRFEMHYTTKGVPTTDRTRLGLVLAKEEPSFVAQTRMIRNFNVEIPPGAKDVKFEYDYELPYSVVLRSVTPHMHLRGRTFRADLIEPDGQERLLIEIPEWDQDWQFSYVFADEVVARKGSRVRITGWYDNSADNPNNPDPSQWVLDGQQIWDEMFMMALEWVRPRGRIRM